MAMSAVSDLARALGFAWPGEVEVRGDEAGVLVTLTSRNLFLRQRLEWVLVERAAEVSELGYLATCIADRAFARALLYCDVAGHG